MIPFTIPLHIFYIYDLIYVTYVASLGSRVQARLQSGAASVVPTSVRCGSSSTGLLPSSMFWKLFKYISGDNIQQQKIEMTVPVMTNVKEVQVRMMVMMILRLCIRNILL